MAPRRAGNGGVLRIIGGSWRGRKLRFTAAPGLRPTPDRVRETLFNWLAAELPDAHCLDLFAGSGALGLEALSRGASHCSFVDSNKRNSSAIQAHLATLGCDNARCYTRDALQWLRDGTDKAKPFDIVFLDPPFTQELAQPACLALEQGAWLAPGALIYLETGSREEPFEKPDNWQLRRDKSTGDVRYQLFVRDS